MRGRNKMDDEAILFALLLLMMFVIFVGVLAWIAIDFILGLLNAPLHVKIAVWLLFMFWFVKPKVKAD